MEEFEEEVSNSIELIFYKLNILFFFILRKIFYIKMSKRKREDNHNMEMNNKIRKLEEEDNNEHSYESESFFL